MLIFDVHFKVVFFKENKKNLPVDIRCIKIDNFLSSLKYDYWSIMVYTGKTKFLIILNKKM